MPEVVTANRQQRRRARAAIAKPGKRAQVQEAITASARPVPRVLSNRPVQMDRIKSVDFRRPDAWQYEVWEFYCQIGPLRYVIHQKADEVGRGKFVAVRRRPDEDAITDVHSEQVLGEDILGEDPLPADQQVEIEEVVETTEPARMLKELSGPYGGIQALARRAALHYDIFAESYLIGYDAKDADGQEIGVQWEFVSPLEVAPDTTAGTAWKRRASHMVEQWLDEKGVVSRLWEPDPAFAGLPDSALRSAAPLCRQVMALDALITAASQSRLAADIMLVPDEDVQVGAGPTTEAEYASTDGGGDAEGDDVDLDTFVEELYRHFTDPNEDPASPNRLVPMLVRWPEETIEKIRFVNPGSRIDSFAADLRKEAYGRLARALDVPPEVMEGKGSTSHWNSWNIDTDLVQKHVLPVGEKIAAFLTDAYLRPRLTLSVADGGAGWTEEQAAEWEIRYEPSKLTARSDTAITARVLYEMGLISADACRKANGFDNTDAPDALERVRAFLERVFTASPYQIAPLLFPLYGLRLPDGVSPFDPSPWTPEDNSQAEKIAKEIVHRDRAARPGTERKPNKAPVDGDSGSDEPERRRRGQPGATADAVLVERLAAAGHMALERALERAGAKIAGPAQRRQGFKERLRDVPPMDIASVFTPSELSSLGLEPNELLAGAWASFERQAQRWVTDWINAARNGHGPDHTAADRARLVVDALVARLHHQALVAFTAPLPLLDNGLRVDPEAIAEALEMAGYVPLGQ